MISPRIGVALRYGHELARGPNGGTFRRRREVKPVEVEGVDWACIRVAGGREFAVADDLGAIGFRPFCPHGVRVIENARIGPRGRRGRRERDYPVFGCYVFIGCPGGLLVARHSHPNILDVLVGPGGSGHVPAKFLELASELWVSGRWDGRIKWARFHAEERVKIKSGPFADFEGIIEELPSETRAIIRFALFGRQTVVNLDIEALELL